MYPIIVALHARILRIVMDQMQREEGQTMAEYGILLSVIAIIVVVAATLLGKNVSSVFSSVAHAV